MRLLRPLIAALFVGAAGIASAQSAAPSFDGKRLESHIKTLSSDAFEGRGPATPGEKKAIDYIVGQLRAAGLEPAGDFDQGRRQWTQAVPLLKADIVGQPKVSISLAAGRPISLAQGEEIAVRAPMNGASAVKLDAARCCSSVTAFRRRSAAGTISRASTSRARSWSSWSTIPISKARCPTVPAGTSAARR
ncbi:hypothetical protein [Sphingomonas rhizophila]|uniref:hypothetical protein n=1 Tax=Sphingomonas rhizophila TaxID=2071607 RepID=UPI0031B56BD8